MSVLPKAKIRELLAARPPLLEGYADAEVQLQPNGFDITLKEIARPETRGTISIDNKDRKVSGLKAVDFGSDGYVNLEPGPYVITFNEIVNLPTNIMALGKPRSSLLRCGTAIHNAVWDAGYSGRSQALLVVYNPSGFRLEKNARVLQLIFLTLESATEGYNGVYQGENKTK
jgi:dUTP pyrophosphatase